MKAFCSFEELGFGDYILYLNWDFKSKTFTKDRHTYGDVLKVIMPEHPNCLPPKRYYKNFNVFGSNNQLNSQDYIKSSINETLQDVKSEFIKETKKTIDEMFSKTPKETKQEPSNDQELIQKFVQHNSLDNNEKEIPKIEHQTMTMTELIKTHNQYSTTFNIHQLNKLEDYLIQINNLNNTTTVNIKNEIKKYIEHIQKNNDGLTQQMKQGDRETKNFLDKFINS